MLPLTGYSDRFSVAPSETIAFAMSAMVPQTLKAWLVRVICADPNPVGPGIKEQDLSQVFTTSVQVDPQPITLGSYGIFDSAEVLNGHQSITIITTVWPTTPKKGRQGIISYLDPHTRQGFALCLDENGALALMLSKADGELVEVGTDQPLRERCWYRLVATFNTASGRITVSQTAAEPSIDDEDTITVESELQGLAPINCLGPLLFAALGGDPPSDFFNGKIEQPILLNGEFDAPTLDNDQYLDLAPHTLLSVDFSLGINTQTLHDIGPRSLAGRLVNLPTRAMTGSNWSGREMCWRHLPGEYGAIHFHDDDIFDCQWKPTVNFKVPDDLKSGVYAMRFEGNDVSDMVPFFVRPPQGQRQADIVLLIPTFTYTVYGNHARNNTDDAYRERVSNWGARPWTPDEHREYGFSTYNFHTDGSGIAYASQRRPMITFRSGYVTFSESFTASGLRHFPADSHLLAWLENQNLGFDVVTDHDLHREGKPLLQSYKAVLTASHPEYHTKESLDAIQGYVAGGGQLAYLGGNGFYWRVAISDHAPGAVEIRRAEGGIRAWAAEPGEYYNAFDGEYGGLWRRNGRPPQRLAGVGFSAQGKFQGSYYRKTAAAADPRCAWLFEGIDEDIIGDFGLSGGGAAGFELDRADTRLGTPEQALIVAHSEQVADHFIIVPEETLTHLYNWAQESDSRLLRADMVYFETPGGGRVFSVGSITFCGSLPHNDFDNNVSRLLRNVVQHFLAS